MSNVSSNHTVVPFVAGESKPLTGQRLARVLYKPRGNKPAQYPSVCVSVPMIPVDVCADTRFHPYFVEYLESVQDKVIKGLYEARKGNLDRVSDSDIDSNAMIAYLVAESAGDRISGDSITAWFNANVRDSLAVLVCEKLGTEDMDDPRVFATVEQYCNILTLIAAKEISYSAEQKRAINRMFEIAGSVEGFGQKLKDKFDAQCGKVVIGVLDI